MRMRTLMVAITLAACTLGAAAQEWPARPIRFIVPWPAGGLNDIIARTFNDRVSKSLGQTVITDFKAGAAGRVGVAEIARAKPDGYTIGMGNLGPLTIFPTLYKQMPFDVKKDLIPVAMFAASPLVLVVPADSPIKTAAELVKASRAKPGIYNFGSVGLGSPAHLTYEMLKSRTGMYVVHIPYRGTAEIVQALMTNDIQSTFDTLPLLLPHIRGGKLRALAVSTPQRVGHLPDVPTLKELGLSDVDVLTWYALIAPAGTPKPIIDRLQKEYTLVSNQPEVQKFLADQGLVYVPNTQAQFAARIEEETRRWAKVIQEKKIEVEQ
jgi:tripartite-type tricarboxylate transporter receptor subunit TctC